MPHRAHDRRRLLPVLAALAVLAGACAMVPGVRPPSVVGPSPERPCAVMSARSCALPYPSDEFTVADGATATGRRVVVPDGLFPEALLAKLGPGAGPADAFAGADGYASTTPIIFELSAPVAPGSLPGDGGDVLALYDLTDGSRVPVRASVPADAARHGAPDTIVMAWPRGRLEFGHTYVARITDGLRARAGGPAPRAPGASGDDPHAASLRADLAAVEGDRWDEVLSATRFTVRSEGDATRELDAMAQVARAAEHPVRNVRVDPPFLVQHASAVVTGEVLLSDFRDAAGVARVAHGATPSWERFTLVLPERAAGPGGAPVVIYGHGITTSKESMVFNASSNAQLGLATIGIDVPNHGSRESEGGYVLEIATARAFGRLASMPLQAVIDHVSLHEAVREELAGLQVQAPASIELPARPAVRLDTDTVFYEGTSMGGVLGAAFVALTPELDGAFLQVPGSGIADIIMNSLIWPLFMGVVPSGATTGDAYGLMGGATMLLDHAENANVLERIRDDGTPLFITYGVGDGVVPNPTTDRMISLTDIPIVGQQLTGVTLPHRTSGSDAVPSDGSGAVQIWPYSSAELQSFVAHISFGQARSVRLLEEWLGNRLAAEGVTG